MFKTEVPINDETNTISQIEVDIEKEFLNCSSMMKDTKKNLMAAIDSHIQFLHEELIFLEDTYNTLEALPDPIRKTKMLDAMVKGYFHPSFTKNKIKEFHAIKEAINTTNDLIIPDIEYI